MENHTTPRQCGRPLEEVQEINLSIRTAKRAGFLASALPSTLTHEDPWNNHSGSKSNFFYFFSFFRGKGRNQSGQVRFIISINNTKFVLLNVPDHVLVERCVGRRSDPVTGKNTYVSAWTRPSKMQNRVHRG
jgi:hypothetical protein